MCTPACIQKKYPNMCKKNALIFTIIWIRMLLYANYLINIFSFEWNGDFSFSWKCYIPIIRDESAPTSMGGKLSFRNGALQCKWSEKSNQVLTSCSVFATSWEMILCVWAEAPTTKTTACWFRVSGRSLWFIVETLLKHVCLKTYIKAILPIPCRQ